MMYNVFSYYISILSNIYFDFFISMFVPLLYHVYVMYAIYKIAKYAKNKADVNIC